MFLLDKLNLGVFLGKLLFKSSALLSKLFGKLLFEFALETLYVKFELLLGSNVSTHISLQLLYHLLVLIYDLLRRVSALGA